MPFDFDINSISPVESGGGDTPIEEKKKYLTRVIDYDGTILKEEWLEEGSRFIMPEIPTHERLLFHHWECDEEIVDNSITTKDHFLICGAIYDTKSGKSEFDIEVPSDNYSFTLNMDGEKDWGDGTTDSLNSHTYQKAGIYMVLCNGTTISGTITPIVFNIRFGNLTSSTYNNAVFGENTVLRTVSLNNGVTSFGNSTYGLFSGCRSLLALVFPRTFTSSKAFCNSYSMRDVVLSPSITWLQNFHNSYVMEYLYIPKKVEGTQDGLQYFSSLRELYLPDGFYYTGTYFLQKSYNLKELVFRSVPTFGVNFCDSCYSLEKIVVPKNTSLLTDGICRDCYNLKEFSGPEECRLSSGGEMFTNCYNLQKFPFIEKASYQGLNSITSYHHKKGNLSLNLFRVLRNLTIDDNDTVTSVSVRGCPCLQKIEFPSYLQTCSSMADNYAMEEYDFTKCRAVPSLSSDLYFSGIRPDAKIYVPFNLYNSWVRTANWSSYKKYIFVKNPAYATFTIDSNNYSFYVNGELETETSFSYAGTTLSYICIDNALDSISFGEIDNISEGESFSASIDFSNIKEVVLNIGVTGLSVSFNIDGMQVPHFETQDGKYYVKVKGSSKDIYFDIDGGNDYIDYSSSVQFTGENIEESISLVPAAIESWTRPNLTANGILGQDAFAVAASQQYSSGYAYYAVNENPTEYNSWKTYSSTSGVVYHPTYTMYNPDALCMTEIIITYYSSSSSQQFTGFAVYGSNDNSSWVEIPSTYQQGSDTKHYNLTLTNSKFYKYYLLEGSVPAYRTTSIGDFAITATKKVPATQG